MFQSTILLLGMWRATLALPDAELPFNFEVKRLNDTTFIEIINGAERLRVNEIEVQGDSLFITLPVFGTEIRVRSVNGLMQGNFINYTRKVTHIPFTARHNETYRFQVKKNLLPQNIDGRYAVKFSPGLKDSSNAVGIFERIGTKTTGTFLTESGDYRYLEGVVDGDSLKLSCFDGVHLFLFVAKYEEDKLNGVFYSGNHWKENWTAVKDKTAELPDLDKLTFLKPGYTKIDFRLPGLDSNMITMNDARFKNKVCVIQIMGSWCPNCMDEAAFFSSFYERYKNKNFEVIGIAFEKYGELAKSKPAIERFKNHFNIQYPVLFAGQASKENVLKALPALANFKGYPTSIIIDKKGNVRQIHTGFTGPATGNYYERYKEEFESFIEKLLAE